FRALGYKTAYAGNIGISYAEIVASEVHLDVIILELSSFQLEHLDTFKADAAILINLTPDHLDRYETVEEYYAVKWNVFKNQTESDIAVLNQEDKNITNSEKIKSLNTLMFSILNKSGSDFGYVNHQIRLYTDMCDAKFIEQFGTHNIENFLAICGVLYHFGHRAKDIIVAQEAFKCAEHRLEKFHTYHCVDFYNDSKATNSDSTKQAINSLYKRQDIHLICGGKEKNLDFTDLVEMIIEKDVKSVSLIGQTADRLEIQLREAGYLKEKIYNLSTLTCVLDFLKMHLNFNHPSSVLLSPATSSYDQFKNFEDRGWIFKELVKEKF
ncbi:MAG: UDP-N-acetylmuramoyl-L-alanine--D-glutamate ligase, partial [Fusobacteria bacterium]|nr:UDP-N-acetylmuramoyl-L-alanine--D-glutamate ligase [Fusobacteriota bacterium]